MPVDLHGSALGLSLLRGGSRLLLEARHVAFGAIAAVQEAAGKVPDTQRRYTPGRRPYTPYTHRCRRDSCMLSMRGKGRICGSLLAQRRPFAVARTNCIDCANQGCDSTSSHKPTEGGVAKAEGSLGGSENIASASHLHLPELGRPDARHSGRAEEGEHTPAGQWGRGRGGWRPLVQ